MNFADKGYPIMILNQDQPLFIHTFSRAIRVTAIFQSADEANQFMEINPEQGVLACYGPLIFVARNRDLGFKIEI
jgi:hypothetical protein